MKKIFAIFLAITLCFSVVGCKPSKEEGKENGRYNVAETTHKIVENGNSDYSIVVSDSADKTVVQAAEEFNYFYKMATGIELSVISDVETSFANDKKLFILGENAISISAGVSVDEYVKGTQGYTLKTKGKSVFILGGTPIGTLYGVYEFLHVTFGFDAYREDEFGIEENVQNKVLYDFDITEKPDFEYRATGYRKIVKGDYATRLRMNYKTDFMLVGGKDVHNAIYYIPPAKHQSEHPKWYATDSGELAFRHLCYTAHGDETEFALMQEAVVNSMKTVILSNPNLDHISFTQADNNKDWCSCDACTASIAHYGGCKIAPIIVFTNGVAKQIKEWLKEVAPERKVTILIFAYVVTSDAPVKYDSKSKTYSPIDEKVVMEDNLGVYYAPITANFYEDINAQSNASVKEIFKKWSVLTENIYLWSYSFNISAYYCFFDTFSSLSENYKFFNEMGTKYIFDQSQYDASNVTAFNKLKAYLVGKVSWKASYDVEELTQKYFDNVFKDAAEPMRAYYDELVEYYAEAYSQHKVSGDFYDQAIMSSAVWTRIRLEKWMGYIDNAREKIAKYETSNPELFTKLSDRITEESISLRFLYIKLHGSRLSASVKEEMTNSLRADMKRLKFDMVGEQIPAVI